VFDEALLIKFIGMMNPAGLNAVEWGRFQLDSQE